MLKKILSFLSPSQMPADEAFAKILILMAEDPVVKLSVEKIVTLPPEKRHALLDDLKSKLGKLEYSVLRHLDDQEFCDKVRATKISK